jgi:hypothetical protein
MRTRLPERGSRRVVRIHDTEGGWVSPPVLVARRFADRLFGLRPAPFGWGLMLRARRVHGIGMVTDLHVVSIDAGAVVGVECLVVGGTISVPAGIVVELPSVTVPPRVGAALEVRPMLGRWPAD